MGMPVFIDGNVPTSLGTNTNEDRIIMVGRGVFARMQVSLVNDGPVTVVLDVRRSP